MGVKVNDADGSVLAVDGAEKGECNGVVTSKRNQTRKCLALLRWARLVGVCVGRAAQEEVVALLDLLECVGVVIPNPNNQLSFPMLYIRLRLRCNRNVTAVNNLGPGVERVRLEWDVVAATKSNPA